MTAVMRARQHLAWTEKQDEVHVLEIQPVLIKEMPSRDRIPWDDFLAVNAGKIAEEERMERERAARRRAFTDAMIPGMLAAVKRFDVDLKRKGAIPTPR